MKARRHPVSLALIQSQWHYDPATSSLTPQWINVDGSAPATTLVYVAGEREYHRTSLDALTNSFAEAFGFIGDLAAFTNSFGPAAGVVVVSFLYYAYLCPNFRLIPLRRHSLSCLLSKNRHLKLSVSRPHDARLFKGQAKATDLDI